MIDVRRRCVRSVVVAGAFALLLGACAVPGLQPPSQLTPAPGAPATAGVRPVARPTAADTAKRACVYSYHRTQNLDAFSAAIGRNVDCALVYNNASPDWANWERPWFMIHGDPNFNWAKWKTAVPGRRLIISQALIPSGLPADWRARGAAGEYDDHARALATNLVAAGLGDSIIRLAHEANGNWSVDGLGYDAGQYGNWKRFWARTARAMRSVPGASFRFDWTINAGYRPIPFNQYYPGDDVVDIIGIDVYDFWPWSTPAPANPILRWKAQYQQPGGLGDLIRFGKQHRKPLSIPEWGLSAVGHKGGAGDNPMFVHFIAGHRAPQHDRVPLLLPVDHRRRHVAHRRTALPGRVPPPLRTDGLLGRRIRPVAQSRRGAALHEGEDEERVVEPGELPVHRLLDRVERDGRTRVQPVAGRELERVLDLLPAEDLDRDAVGGLALRCRPGPGSSRSR